MDKEWVRVKSTHGAWYEVSNYGEVLKKYYVLVDSKGRLRGTTEKRKTTKVLRCEEKQPFWDRFSNRWRMELLLPGYDGKVSISLQRLVAICFVDQPKGYNIVRFKDGNVNNVAADNLYWDKRPPIPEEYLPHNDPYDVDYIKYYRVRKDHKLYKQYMEYLDNRRKLQELVIKFMKQHNLLCGLVKTGTRKRHKRKRGKLIEFIQPYFFISDKDERIIEHDVVILGNAACKRRNDGYVPIRINSQVMYDWKDLINDEKYEAMKIPDIHPFITFKEMRWGITKSFRMVDDRLYLRVESRCDYDIESLKEIKTGAKIFGEKEVKKC